MAAKEITVPQAACRAKTGLAKAWIAIIAMALAGTWLSYSLFGPGLQSSSLNETAGPLIGSLYAFGLFLGTIYSVPPEAELQRLTTKL